MNGPALLCATFLAVLLTGAQVLFKVFASQKQVSLAAWHSLLPLAGALGLYFVVFVLYAQALRRFDLAVLYPSYTALSVLMTFAAGAFVFREQVTPRMVLGCCLLIVAVFLISSPVKK